MAYGLKYSQYLEQGAQRILLKVYQKDYSGTAYGMAHLTGASLQLVGGQSDILSPTLKTAFSWSLADCWDEGTTQPDGTTCVNAAGEKCGKWEEFYTNDATKYKVEVSVLPDGGSAYVIWTGFVTPDSWNENLIYRGSITITARDMLGALRDKEFDLTGRVSVLDVVQGALAACECPMALSYTAAHFLQNSNGQSILAHTFAASTFSGDTWQDALDDTLESLGLVLRYNGNNGIVLTSLRYLKADTLRGTHGAEFTGRSGLRSLDPAVKLIDETFTIDFEAQDAADPALTQYALSGLLMQQNKKFANTYPDQRYDITQYTLTAPLDGGLYGNLAVPVPETATIEEGAPTRKFYVPVDIVNRGSATGYSTANSLSYYNTHIFAPFRAIINVDGPMLKFWPANGGRIAPVSSYFDFKVAEIKVRVVASVNGSARYLGPDGWDTSVQEFPITPGDAIEVPALENGTNYSVQIWEVNTEGAGMEWEQHTTPPNDFFFCTGISIRVEPPTTSTTPTEFKTTTIYNEDNNVVITRKPEIGPANTDMAAAFCRNVLAYGDNIAPDEWNWPGASSYLPLAVMIQAQVLCYHSAAASVFTGTMHDKTSDRAAALPGYGISYYTRDCLPTNGTYDFVTGLVGQATLREVYTWEQVWGGGFNPQYTQQSGSGKGSTSATGAGGSSVSPGGGSSGGGGGTNYFELSGSDVQLKSAYEKLILPVLQVTGNTTIGGTLGVTGAATLSSTLAVTGLATLSGGISLGGTYNSQDSKLVWDATNNAWHLIGNFYADGFVSAGGISSGGGSAGIDLQAMWNSLQNNDIGTSGPAYEHRNDKIHTWHLPACGTGLSYTTDSGGLATGINVSFPVTSVAGKTGAVTLAFSDITGTASTSQIPDLSGTYLPLAGGTLSNTSTSTGYAGRILEIVSPATSNVWMLSMSAPNLASYSSVLIMIGEKNEEGKSAWFGYTSRATSEYGFASIGLYNKDNLLTIHGNGNIGIGKGTTVPSYKFDVNGTLNATTIYQNGVALGDRAFDSTAYLPLAGGTLENTARSILTIKQTSGSGTYGPYISFAVGTNIVADVGHNSSIGSFLGHYTSGTSDAYINVTANGLFWKNDKTFYHSGNLTLSTLAGVSTINAASAAGKLAYYSATTAIGAYTSTIGASNKPMYLNAGVPMEGVACLPLTGGTLSGTDRNTLFVLNHTYTTEPPVYGPYVSLEVNGSYKGSIGWNSNFGIILANGVGSSETIVNLNANGFFWKNDKLFLHSGNTYVTNGKGYINSTEITTISGNAATATSWASNASVWGQSLNAGSSVTGDMSNVGNISFSASGKNIGGIMYFDTTNARIGIGTANPNSYSKVTMDGGSSTSYPLRLQSTLSECSQIYAASGSTAQLGHYVVGCYTGAASGGPAYFIYDSTLGKQTFHLENGRVGIGTGAAYPSCALDVDGVIHSTTGIFSDGYVTAGSASSREFKDNVQNMSLEYARNIIMSSRPITFQWNALAYSLCDKYEGDGIGFIAQEAEQLMPFAVSPIFEKYKRLDYTKFVAPLVCVAQDHETRIRELERENKELKEKLNRLTN